MVPVAIRGTIMMLWRNILGKHQSKVSESDWAEQYSLQMASELWAEPTTSRFVPVQNSRHCSLWRTAESVQTRNRSSAHSAPPCACAMETVSCNDMSVMYCRWRVHITAPLFAMTTSMELASCWASEGTQPEASKKWTTTDRSSGAPRQEVRNTSK